MPFRVPRSRRTSKIFVRKKSREHSELKNEEETLQNFYGSLTKFEDNSLEKVTCETPVKPDEPDCKSASDNCTNEQDTSVYFHDGLRRIDYVLAYEEDGPATKKDLAKRSAAERESRKRKIQQFRENLIKEGLEIEEDACEGKKNLRFLKIYIPWNVLSYYAEELGFRAPLKQVQSNNSNENWSEGVIRALGMPNPFSQDVPHQSLRYYSCPFRRSKMDRFCGSGDRDNYFSPAQRSRIAYEILSSVAFGERRKGEVGVGRLVEERILQAAYPLHEGSYKISWDISTKLNLRQILYEYWARWGRWNKYQPLDAVRNYFGEKIAIYFAWLGFYTAWLIPVAFVGVMVFLYGVFTMNDDIISQEICRSGSKYRMCPLCDEKIGCKYWNLSDICTYARVAYLFDHPGTIAFSIFVSFWAVTFLEYWKRQTATLAHDWDCLDVQDEEVRPRPEFAIHAPLIERNPVTGIPEPSFPANLRRKRIAAGVGVVALMISMVVIFLVAVIVYRIVVSTPLFQHEQLRSQAQAIASLSGACVNLVVIMILGRVYENLAYKITTWEMHRTQTEFEDNLTFKVFLFQFVNLYASIFYIAFFKGRFVGYPGHYNHILGLRNEECSAGGCLIELAQQLAIIMIGKQIINNAQEILWPKFQAWWRKRKVKIKQSSVKRWEEDFQLIENAGLFEEYLEMVMQFGFITIFVAAFPLAPLFALLNNIAEIRLDALKFVTETRRPVAERAKDIGIWFAILDVLARIAVISNGFLIAFTSDFIPRLLYQYDYDWSLRGYVKFTLAQAPNGTLSQPCYYRGFRDQNGNVSEFFWKLLAIRLAFLLAFEHFVFGVCRLIDLLVPDVPYSLELKMKRERYLAKQVLQDPDNLLKAQEDTLEQVVTPK